MPAKPAWLLAVPDAIGALEELDRELITRRDIESLFGVSRARAWQLLHRFGARRTVNVLTIGRGELIAKLQAIEAGDEFQTESARKSRMVTHLRQARAAKVRVPAPPEIAGLPEGVHIEQGRIEVRFDEPKQGIQRLYALAQALLTDYDRFESLAGPPRS